MPANKRSRSCHSQSFINVSLHDQPPPPPQPRDYFALQSNNQMRLTTHDAQSRQDVFSAPSSPPKQGQRRLNDEGFLQRCYQCKKLLDHTKDINMYNDCAFCTQECRNGRIAMDKVAEDARKRGAAACTKTTSIWEMNR